MGEEEKASESGGEKDKVKQMYVDDECRRMEEMNDERVLLKQKAWFDEEVRYLEMRRKFSENENKEENKRKRQISVGKKKKSKSKKKDNLKEKERCDKNEVNNPFRGELPEKLDPLFAEVGLQRNDHKIYKVKEDGACAGNCVAAHCYGDSMLGKYVNRNMKFI